jgi:hypothetical protein
MSSVYNKLNDQAEVEGALIVQSILDARKRGAMSCDVPFDISDIAHHELTSRGFYTCIRTYNLTTHTHIKFVGPYDKDAKPVNKYTDLPLPNPATQDINSIKKKRIHIAL